MIFKCPRKFFGQAILVFSEVPSSTSREKKQRSRRARYGFAYCSEIFVDTAEDGYFKVVFDLKELERISAGFSERG